MSASFADPMASWRANLFGTLALGEAVLREAPGCRFVLASSAEVYGLSFRAPMPLDEQAPMRPANPYAASKAACDLAIGEMALRGLDAVRLRAFNHTGPGQSEGFVVAAFARQIARVEQGLQAPELRVGALDRWRDFLDVRDVCAAYAAALRGPTSDVTTSEPGLRSISPLARRAASATSSMHCCPAPWYGHGSRWRPRGCAPPTWSVSPAMLPAPVKCWAGHPPSRGTRRWTTYWSIGDAVSGRAPDRCSRLQSIGD